MATVKLLRVVELPRPVLEAENVPGLGRRGYLSYYSLLAGLYDGYADGR